MRIALLDENNDEAELIRLTLSAAGMECKRYAAAEVPADPAFPDFPDLLIFAAGNDGDRATLADLRRLPAGLPVLLIADRAARHHILEALKEGVNDYLLRPLRRPELVARVRILLQRSYPDRQPEKAAYGPYVFEIETGRLTMAGRAVDVTQKEFHLALLFFRHLGRPLSRAFIRDRIWPGEAEMPSRTLDKHVSRVRSKLRLAPEQGYRLVPVYSFGYRLEQPGAEQAPGPIAD